MDSPVSKAGIVSYLAHLGRPLVVVKRVARTSSADLRGSKSTCHNQPKIRPADPKSAGPRYSLLATLLVIAIWGLGASVSLAKKKEPQSKTVSGVVMDESDNPIEGAAIELTDAQSGKVIEIYSQEDGSYHFEGLSFSHDYKIKATFKGSSSEVRQISSIDMRPRLVLNLTIPGQKH